MSESTETHLKSRAMTPVERRSTGALAGIFALRMFGLFLILPVFALYARDLPGASPVAIGLALGIYGASQALLQIPYGLASDRIGRKPVITLGLLIFAAGSVVAATAQTMEWIIVGRALQGAGAVAAAVLALTADLTRDSVRTKSMAIIGVSIGGSFMLALMVAPVLEPRIGVPGLFWLTAALTFVAIAVLWFVVPAAPVRPRTSTQGALRRSLRDGNLMRMNVGIFVLHAILMALFVAVPVLLLDSAGLQTTSHWKVYVPVLLASVPALGYLVRMSHGEGGTRRAMLIGIVLVVVSMVALIFVQHSFYGIALALVCFFSGFNSLEAMLPSLTSRLAPADIKGAALGVFNTFEFLGIFVGGLAGGAAFAAFGGAGVFGLCAAAALVWLVVMWGAGGLENALNKASGATQTFEIQLGARTPGEAAALETRLSGYDGVREVTLDSASGRIRLTIDPERFDRRVLDEFVDTVNIRLDRSLKADS